MALPDKICKAKIYLSVEKFKFVTEKVNNYNHNKPNLKKKKFKTNAKERHKKSCISNQVKLYVLKNHKTYKYWEKITTEYVAYVCQNMYNAHKRVQFT